MTNYNVMYLRARPSFPHTKGQPVGCIVYDNEGKSAVQWQISILNPVDHFHRELSRSLAIGRFVERPYTVFVNGPHNKHDTIRAILREIAVDHSIPSRARRAASLWIKVNTFADIPTEVVEAVR
jgi:hypothetical protein